MDNYEAMNFYYGLLNLHAGLFTPNLCELLMLVAQSVPEKSQPATAYHEKPAATTHQEEPAADELTFGSFYDDGHILHNVKIDTQSDFFLDPTRGDTVKWHVSFTVAKDVRPADQFIVQLSDNLIVAPNGHPQHPIEDYVDQDGVVIAMGEYHADKHQLVYTFTNYVTEHRQIIGAIDGELSIDPLTVPENAFGMKCYLAIDNYRRDFTIDVDYPDLSTNTFLGITSRMMRFDQDRHLFTALLYVNLAEKNLDHGYIIFNTSEMVEELSNAVVSPSKMRIEVFQNVRHLDLPQSYGVDLRRLRDVTNRFPIVEGDHLVDTPWTISFADNKMRLNLGADDSTASYVLRIVGQYNDELDGGVRLRARLFGVDESNVYMSNSTAAAAQGVTMSVAGTAVMKGHVPLAAAKSDDGQEDEVTSQDVPYDELASTGDIIDDEPSMSEETVTDTPYDDEEPADSSVPVASEQADAESSAYIISFDDAPSPAADEAKPAVDQEPASASLDVADLEDESATEYDRRFARLLKKNMAELAGNYDALTEKQATAEELPLVEHHVKIIQPTEVFLPKTPVAAHQSAVSTVATEETVAEKQPQEEAPAENAALAPVVVVTEDPISEADLAASAIEVTADPQEDEDTLAAAAEKMLYHCRYHRVGHHDGLGGSKDIRVGRHYATCGGDKFKKENLC